MFFDIFQNQLSFYESEYTQLLKLEELITSKLKTNLNPYRIVLYLISELKKETSSKTKTRRFNPKRHVRALRDADETEARLGRL